MLLAFVGLIAIEVSLCGARPSQSVATFAADDGAVEQIGLAGFLYCEAPEVASVLFTSASYPFQCSCVMARGNGSSAQAVAASAANAAATTTAVVRTAMVRLLIWVSPPRSICLDRGDP